MLYESSDIRATRAAAAAETMREAAAAAGADFGYILAGACALITGFALQSPPGARRDIAEHLRRMADRIDQLEADQPPNLNG